MGRLATFIKEFLGARMIVDSIGKHDPVKLGKSTRKVVDKFFDRELGNSGSETVQDKLIPFMRRFFMGFSEEIDI